MFMQSARWTETPLPLVIKPVILSPGTGAQHLASFTSTSPAPSTSIPVALFRSRLTGFISGDKSFSG